MQNVRTRISGEVSSFAVAAGDAVQAGQTVATIRDTSVMLLAVDFPAADKLGTNKEQEVTMKKLMSVLLASAMILALAAGCGESAAPAQSAAPETAAPSGAAADTADLPEVTIHVASIFQS